MPFLTEEIWQYISDRDSDNAIMISEYPKFIGYDSNLISSFETVKEIVSGVRTIRKEKNISFKRNYKFICVKQR